MTSVLRGWTFAVLWIFVLVIPWEAAAELPSIGTLGRAVGLLAVPVALAALVAGGRRHRLLDSHVLVMALTVWVLGSTIWSIRPSVSLRTAGTMVQLLVMTLLLWEFGREEGRRRRLLWAFVIGAMLGSLAVFRASLADEAVTNQIRFTEGGLNENHAAFMFSVAIPVAWYLSLTSARRLHRWVAGLYVPAAVVAAVLTGSRGGLLTLFVALSIVPLTLRRGGVRVKVVALVVLAMAVVAVGRFVPPQTIERLETIPTQLSTGELGTRREAWEATWTVFGSQPLNGVGAGSSRFQIARIVGFEQGPHNTYLSLAADLGVVGLGLFLLVLVSIVGRWTNLRGGERQLVAVLLITMVVGLVPGHWEYLKVTWLMIAIMLAEVARAIPTMPGSLAGPFGRSVSARPGPSIAVAP